MASAGGNLQLGGLYGWMFEPFAPRVRRAAMRKLTPGGRQRPGSARRRASRSDEVGEWHAQGVSQPQQDTKGRVGRCVLDAVHGLVVDPDGLGERLLRKAGVCTGGPDARADDAAAGEHPVGLGGWWHPSTLE